LLRQVLATLAMTVAVFTFVLLLANVLKEILALLVNRHISLMLAGEAIALLIPFVLVFALPMGMLTAALLVFGRFSADNELTAARASGVSLIALISPILLMSVVFSGVCAVVNMHLAPYCRIAYKRLLFDFTTQQAGLLIPEKTFIKDFPNFIVYAGEVDDSNLRDVVVYNLNDDRVESYIRASEGRFEVDRARQIVRVFLNDAWSVSVKEVEVQKGESRPVEAHFEQIVHSFTNNPASGKRDRLRLTDMTFLQLRSQLAELERQLGKAEAKPSTGAASSHARAQLEEKRENLTLPIRVQLNRQVAFSFACIGFTLVGIPLGIRAHRRETTFGIAMALVLVLVYYAFFIFAEAMDTRAEWMPHIVLWLPNFIFQAVGGILLWRANRGL
jgi:lipopolysaccharide export system permease protein